MLDTQPPVTDAALDAILELQLAVAWAGEANTDPPRLGWWRTSMCEEYGGEDLLRRLTPRTWAWATLETCRAAARRVDDRKRRTGADDPDHLVTLFRLNAHLDARLDERLRELKLSGRTPAEALPGLGEATSDGSIDAFASWLRGKTDDNGDPDPGVTTTPLGRRLRGASPEGPIEIATRLARALLPFANDYPLPHFRIAR